MVPTIGRDATVRQDLHQAVVPTIEAALVGDATVRQDLSLCTFVPRCSIPHAGGAWYVATGGRVRLKA